MAIVSGIREKVHLPIYDSLKISPEEQLRDVENSGTLKFFINVQNKTKLETNLQSASLLPHYNTFEARAMRVVISDLPAEYPNDVSQEETDNDVSGPNGDPVGITGAELTPPIAPGTKVQADIDIPLDRLIELLKEAKDSSDDTASVDLDDDIVTLVHLEGAPGALTGAQVQTLIDSGASLDFSTSDLQSFLDDFDEKDQPLPQQLESNNGSGNLIGKIIYNTVTSLYVGEKVMIQVPTWFFPGGAGPFSETANITTHGTPSPQDTFRFAEPIFIDRQQNFRVEIEIPDSDVLKGLQRIYGPMYMWVVLDGYMTRGVQ
jgi:hypothetical protein